VRVGAGGGFTTGAAGDRSTLSQPGQSPSREPS